MSKVFIGMPVYNGEKFIRNSLTSFINQTFKDWELLIADNASTDATNSICYEFVAKDTRITYIRHESNKGGLFNYEFLLNKSSSPFFMWAACDDIWKNDFIKKGVNFLEENEKFDAWFPTVQNIDSFGNKIRECPSFERLTSSGSKFKDVINYLFEPEILGKANLIYSIFKRKALQNIMDKHILGDTWGSDMCFNLAFLSRYNIKCDREVLFLKRVCRETDIIGNPHLISIEKPNRHIFPLHHMIPYLICNLNAVNMYSFKFIVILSFICRLPLAVRNYFYESRIAAYISRIGVK